MQNIFRDEAWRAIRQGGVLGNLFMIREYADFSIVEDDDLSPEQKLNNAVEMLDLEVKNYKKEAKKIRTKNIIKGVIAILLCLGLLVLLFVKLPGEAFATLAVLHVFLLMIIVFALDDDNDNKLVLFWIVYIEKLFDDLKVPPEVKAPIQKKLRRAARIVT